MTERIFHTALMCMPATVALGGMLLIIALRRLNDAGPLDGPEA